MRSSWSPKNKAGGPTVPSPSQATLRPRKTPPPQPRPLSYRHPGGEGPRGLEGGVTTSSRETSQKASGNILIAAGKPV